MRPGCPADLDGDGEIGRFHAAGGIGAQRRTPVSRFPASNGRCAAGEESSKPTGTRPTGSAVQSDRPDLDLSGWYLTDNSGNLTKWQFPSGTRLNPNGYLVVFASGKDRTAGQLHTNFQLAAAGAYLALVKSDGRTVADEYDLGYPEQLTDVSYGLGQSAAQFISSGSTVSYHVPRPEERNG
jgi:hypothetical protein